MAARTLPETPRSARRLDGWSVVLNALTFGLLITGVDGLSAGELTCSLLALSGAAVAGFVFVCYPLSLPMLPLDLLRRPVCALPKVTSVCSFATHSLADLTPPFYFHGDLGRSITQTGMLMTAWPGISVVAPIASRLGTPLRVLGPGGVQSSRRSGCTGAHADEREAEDTTSEAPSTKWCGGLFAGPAAELS